MKAPKSYADAQAKLEALLERLRSDEVEVDAIAETVAEAKALIEWSQQRLRKTEKEIDTLFSDEG